MPVPALTKKAAEAGPLALAGREIIAASGPRFLRSPAFKERRSAAPRRGGGRPAEATEGPRRQPIRAFIAACAATVGLRAGALRSRRLRCRGAATSTLEQPAKTGPKKKFRFLSPLAFKQWTNWPTELGAGVTTAVVALPLAMAFGVTSGAGPLAGLYGAIFTGFFAALFGGTPAQVTGPTGPMAVIMAATIAKCPDPELVFFVVAMSGIMQITMGVLRLGGAIRLVPRTVLSGFMSGIGGIICSLQLSVMLGHPSGGNVVKALMNLPYALTNPNLPNLGMGLFTLFMLYKLPERFTFNVPRPLLALVAACLVNAFALPMIGISIPCLGAIPSGLPMLHIPSVSAGLLMSLAPLALTLAVLGAVDSLLTSLVADSMTSSFHDSDRELVGQGIGNAVAGVLGGHAGAGATMRTVVNVRTGGRTPISGATHSVVLLAMVMGLGPLAKYVPLSCLSGILIKSGLDVVDWALVKRASHLPRSEVAILLVTFLTTVLVDLIVAVAAGWALAIVVFFYKTSQLQLGSKGVKIFDASNAESAPEHIRSALADSALASASVVRLSGQVAFGAAQGLLKQLVPEVVGKKLVVVDLSDVVLIDTSAVLSLDELFAKVSADGGKAYVCGARRTTDGFNLFDSLDLTRHTSNSSVEDKLTPSLLA